MSELNAARQPRRELLGNRRLRPGRRDNREFVAADAREKRALADRLHPARDFPQQRVADRMAEHVVDRFEPIQIDAENAETFVRTRHHLDAGVDALVERRPVRQIGERIVMRHMGDALFASLDVGNVVDNGDEVF